MCIVVELAGEGSWITGLPRLIFKCFFSDARGENQSVLESIGFLWGSRLDMELVTKVPESYEHHSINYSIKTVIFLEQTHQVG